MCLSAGADMDLYPKFASMALHGTGVLALLFTDHFVQTCNDLFF